MRKLFQFIFLAENFSYDFSIFPFQIWRWFLLHRRVCSFVDKDKSNCENFQSQQAVSEETVVDFTAIAADHL
jgi:hypothetical protein